MFEVSEDLRDTSASQIDEDMTEANEVSQKTSADDIAMTDKSDTLPSMETSDEVMAGSTEDLQGLVLVENKTEVTEAETETQIATRMEEVQSTLPLPASQPLIQHDKTTSSSGMTSPQLRTIISAADLVKANQVFDDEIKSKLVRLGPDFHTNLRDEHGQVHKSVQQITPFLDPIIIKHISTPLKKAEQLIGLLRLRFGHRIVSLDQLKAILSCAEKIQADKVLASAPVQQTAILAPRNEVPFAKETELTLEEPTLNTQCIANLLKQAHAHVSRSSWAQFSDMFDLPWNNKKRMEETVNFVVKHKDYGNGSLDTAKAKIEEEYSAGSANNVQSLLWICRTDLHRREIQPITVTARCSYADIRKASVSDLLKDMAEATYENMKLGLACLTWEEMIDLAKRREHHFPQSTIGTIKRRDPTTYKNYIKAEREHWIKPQNMLSRIAAQQPVAPASTGKPAEKRRNALGEVPDPKRAKPTELALPEAKAAQRRRRDDDDGTYSNTPVTLPSSAPTNIHTRRLGHRGNSLPACS